ALQRKQSDPVAAVRYCPRMKTRTRLLNPHRFAQIVRWAQAMLAWLALVLCSETARIDRRHIRQRYRFVSLDWIERLIGALVLIRTVEITGIEKQPRSLRNAAPTGFRRRIKRAGRRRATLGSRLRKALKHRDPRERIRRLMAALADIDAFARRYLVPRALRRLTKLYAIVMTAPPADAVHCLAARSVCFADSS
ncbi:MAG: hypothetical protein ACT4OF_13565, partial [Caulobacteraceae bacterium]